MKRFSGDISIVLGGSAGQGIQTVEALLVQVLKREGYNVFACKEYMSRVRGGSNSTEIRVTNRKRSAYVRHIDLLLALDKGVLPHLLKRITARTIVLGEREKLGSTEYSVIDIPFTRFTAELGHPMFVSTIAVGVVLGILKADEQFFEDYLREHFARKGEDVVEKNIRAAKMGYMHGKHLAYDAGIEVNITRHPKVSGELLLDGTQALSLGALAGGCHFISSYPMSPGTGLLTFLAEHGRAFGVVVDQAEDEIAAVNAGIGVWYAGARALVTTSGGGFDLMTEAISLAGMTETPIVVHIGMRPGPATGLPTRTEQGDLNLVLYAGHGEFPRAIFAPGTREEAFSVMRQAFEVADQFQIPVFVLSEQFFLDGITSVPVQGLNGTVSDGYIVKTKVDYKRYSVTENGVSPRGVPGYGSGLVCVDSDEHTEDGHITESSEVRVMMHEKRLRKLVQITELALMPTEIGDVKHSETVVVAWGSNRGVLEEALEKVGRDEIAGLHFAQLYPLPTDAKKLFRGKQIVVLENNATGQFAELLKREYGIKVSETILKYDGDPFCVEEVVAKLQKILDI